MCGLEKKSQSRIVSPVKIFFKNESEIMTYVDKRNERIHHQQSCTTRNAKGSSLDRSEMHKMEILIFRKEWKTLEMVNKYI